MRAEYRSCEGCRNFRAIPNGTGECSEVERVLSLEERPEDDERFLRMVVNTPDAEIAQICERFYPSTCPQCGHDSMIPQGTDGPVSQLRSVWWCGRCGTIDNGQIFVPTGPDGNGPIGHGLRLPPGELDTVVGVALPVVAESTRVLRAARKGRIQALIREGYARVKAEQLVDDEFLNWARGSE